MMLHLLLILSISPLALTEEETTTIIPTTIIPTTININPETYVNCGHAEHLLQLDTSQYNVGTILTTCWNHGVTLDELNNGISQMDDLREDIEKYNYSELYISCEDVFTANITRLTTNLLEDYVNCLANNALSENVKNYVDVTFSDILQVYYNGNSSVTIDESTLVPCDNASQRITLLCREYGLTGDQWHRGFLRYYHNDKWIVEEEITELSLGCDRIFNAKLYEDVYEDFLDAFIKCSTQTTLNVDVEVRDGIEKKYAKELMELRGIGSSDLRGYVSCRHLIPVSMKNGAFSASWYAYDQCRAKGLTYEQLCYNGTITRDEFDEPLEENDVRDMYLECESVFNDDLYSFTTGLIKDYQSCKEIGKIDEESKMMLQKKFFKLFELLATKRPKKSLQKIAEDLIPCSSFTGALADECRRHGSTLAQELRGIGSLAVILGDKWLNTEPLDKLYIRCDDVFDKYLTYLDDVPLEKFIQCRWNEGMTEDGMAYVDMRISEEYKNEWKFNDTRFIGDADVEISSAILFTEEHVLPLEETPNVEESTE